ncbi:hypothetical protein J2T13_000001 [Paenibacillus sp. DS2015]|uniref:hypothetical protein n=1 Tax=Paenibacillus sp. DS2015 TaxID=3373917 RepID=UPI003D1B13BB
MKTDWPTAPSVFLSSSFPDRIWNFDAIIWGIWIWVRRGSETKDFVYQPQSNDLSEIVYSAVREGYVKS